MNTLVEFPGIFLTAVIYVLACNIFWLCKGFKVYKDVYLFRDIDELPLGIIGWALNLLGIFSLILYFIYS